MSTESDTRLHLLYDLSCAFAAQIELDELLPSIVERGRELFAADGVSLLLLDPARGELSFPYVAEEDPTAAARLLELRLRADEGIAGNVLQSGRATRSDDVRLDPRFFAGVDAATRTRTGPLLAAPLVCRGTTIGVIEVIRRTGATPFDDRDLEFLSTLASSVAVAIDNARLHAARKASEQRLRVTVGELQRDLARRDGAHEIIGAGTVMQQLLELVETAAAHPITVLLQGETGTGKELVARRIHHTSARGTGPFIPVNCAALPQTLLESELFGHRKGSFTDALEDRVGLFEAASGGTIFLDEVGETPPVMQAKLLRVLQEGEIVPVGDTRPRRVDVRVISATNRDLAEEVQRGAFREDLYYRLSAFPIRVASLRERREDIALLVDSFVAQAARKHGRTVRGIDGDALELLVASPWPGNVRQLQNEIERAVVLTPDGGTIAVSHLSVALLGAIPSLLEAGGTIDAAGSDVRRPLLPLREARARFETAYLQRALAVNGGNVSGTARMLGMSRFMVQKKIRDYGLR